MKNTLTECRRMVRDSDGRHSQSHSLLRNFRLDRMAGLAAGEGFEPVADRTLTDFQARMQGDGGG